MWKLGWCRWDVCEIKKQNGKDTFFRFQLYTCLGVIHQPSSVIWFTDVLSIFQTSWKYAKHPNYRKSVNRNKKYPDFDSLLCKFRQSSVTPLIRQAPIKCAFACQIAISVSINCKKTHVASSKKSIYPKNEPICTVFFFCLFVVCICISIIVVSICNFVCYLTKGWISMSKKVDIDGTKIAADNNQ